MAITKFQSQIWAAALLVRFAATEVIAPTVNRSYEGDLAKGNTVHITSVTTPTVVDYKAAGRVINPADLADTQIDLLVDQEKAFAFNVDDIDRVQAAGSFEPVTMDAAAALVEDSESFLASKLLTGGFNVDQHTIADGATTINSTTVTSAGSNFTLNDVGKAITGAGIAAATTIVSLQTKGSITISANATATAAGVALTIGTAGAAVATGDDAFNVANRIRTALGNNKVPSGDRYLVVNPQFSSFLLGANSKLTAANTAGSPDGLRDATVGRLLGMTVIESPLLQPGKAAAVGYHRSALGYVNQIEKVEALRSQTKFADIVRALHVYGAKTIRQDAVVSWTA